MQEGWSSTSRCRQCKHKAHPSSQCCTRNKVPRWGASTGDFSVELWLNQVEMLRTMIKWTEEQTKEAYFLSMEGATATWNQATLRDEEP